MDNWTTRRRELKAHGLAWRLFSASEVLLGAVIVIGHNVFHVAPNEVPILFVLGLVSVRVRDGGWSAIGFRRPESWLRLVLRDHQQQALSQKAEMPLPVHRSGSKPI
jgi:hypothetical protein